MMKELETVAPLTGGKRRIEQLFFLCLNEVQSLGQRIKSFVAPHADCFEKENRPSGGGYLF